VIDGDHRDGDWNGREPSLSEFSLAYMRVPTPTWTGEVMR
jgi:hypothetical protein